jgi:hypothetical protein
MVRDAEATGNPPSIMDMLGKTNPLTSSMGAEAAAVGATAPEMDLLRFLMKDLKIGRGQAQNMIAMNSPEAAKAAAEAVLAAASSPAKAEAILAAGAKLGLAPAKTDLAALNKMFDAAIYGPGRNPLYNPAMGEGPTAAPPIAQPGPAGYNVAKPMDIVPPPRPAVPRVPDMLDARAAAAQAISEGRRLAAALGTATPASPAPGAAAGPRQVVATPVMPKMGVWDHLLGVTQTIEPGEETVGAAAGAAAPKAAEAAAEAAAPAAAGTAAEAAAGTAAAESAAAGTAAESAAAAAAKLGWKETAKLGVGALLKKAGSGMWGKGAGTLGKTIGMVGPQVLMTYLLSQLMNMGLFMPGGRSTEERAMEGQVQQLEGQLRMAEAQMPSEAMLAAQAALGPAQQEAQAAQGQALQSGALADMGWM